MLKRTIDFLEKYGKENGNLNDGKIITQASLARSIGISSSQLSLYIKGKYPSNTQLLESKIKDFINNYEYKDIVLDEFKVIKTDDLNKVNFVINEAIVCHDMAIIYGKAGCGKTVAIKEFVSTHPEAILIEVIPGMSTKSLLNDICDALSVSKGSNDVMVKSISKAFKKREAVLIIDEAENLTTKSLEAVRRIYDFSNVATILVGTYALLNNLKGRKGELLQLYSRISGKWEFRGLNDDDWINLFNGFANDIKKITTHLRRAVNVYKKAVRFSNMKKEDLNVKHIAIASTMVILD